MRRHLGFFEEHVLTHHRVELLQLELVGLRALVLLRVIGVAGAGGRNEADVFAHGTGLLSRDIWPCKTWRAAKRRVMESFWGLASGPSAPFPAQSPRPTERRGVFGVGAPKTWGGAPTNYAPRDPRRGHLGGAGLRPDNRWT